MSIGLFTCIMMNAQPISTPAMMRMNSVFASTIPRATTAIRLAWGAGSFSPPKPARVPRMSFCRSGEACLISSSV